MPPPLRILRNLADKPEFTVRKSVLPFVQKRKLVVYDNNLLGNPHIDRILAELRDYRMKGGVPLSCESQSGFDLGYLTPERAQLLEKCAFRHATHCLGRLLRDVAERPQGGADAEAGRDGQKTFSSS